MSDQPPESGDEDDLVYEDDEDEELYNGDQIPEDTLNIYFTNVQSIE